MQLALTAEVRFHSHQPQARWTVTVHFSPAYHHRGFADGLHRCFDTAGMVSVSETGEAISARFVVETSEPEAAVDEVQQLGEGFGPPTLFAGGSEDTLPAYARWLSHAAKPA